MTDQASPEAAPEPASASAPVPDQREPEPVPEPEQVTEEATEQVVMPASDESNDVPQQVESFQPSADLNGTVDIPAIDPITMMNGFPLNGDPNYMPAQIDPMQAGLMPVIPEMQSLTPDEIALYDRQIRLWGIQAQKNIRSANILLIGMKGLGSEIAKNLVLAGIGILTILDHEVVTEDDLGAQFLVSEDKIGQSRAQVAQAELQKLNPRVEIYVDTDIVFTKMPEYFSTFDITVATGLPLDALTAINMNCRSYERKFYAADTHGMYGFIFADLLIHEFIIEKDKSNKPTKPGVAETPMRLVLSVTEKKENNKVFEIVKKQEQYSPLLLVNSSPLPEDLTRTIAKKKKVTPLLACFRALLEFQRSSPDGHLPKPTDKNDLMVFAQLCNQKQLELDLPREALRSDILRSFLSNIGAELSPVVAFLGGNLAQDVINVLSQREQPLQNYLLFDGESMSSYTYSIHPNLEALGMQITDGMGVNGVMDGMGADVGAAADMNGTMAAA